MYLLIVFLSFAALYTIYMIAYFVASLALGVHEHHYVFGFGRPFFSFRLKKVKFSVGLFIPVLGLARIRTVVGDKLLKRRYPWEFENASRMKRLLVTIAGPLALLLSGIVFIIVDIYTTKESFISKEFVNKSGVVPSAWALDVGFAEGDQIIAVNGKDYTNYFELNDRELLKDSNTTFTVLRDGKQLELRIGKPPEGHPGLREPFLWLNVPFEIGKIVPGSSAEAAGLEAGDRIIKVNETSITARMEMIRIFDKDEDGVVTLQVVKASANPDTIVVEANLAPDRRLGFFIRDLFEYSYHENTLGEAIQKGTRAARNEISIGFRAFYRTFFGTAKGTLSGPIGIVDSFEARYARRTASSAIWYFFYNFLPLPLSVFWEIIPIAYEGITRKKYSYKAFDWGLVIGWIVLFIFFVWTFVSDLTRIMS